MLQAVRVLPAEMSGDHKTRPGKLPDRAFHRNLPCLRVCIRKIAKVGVFRAFYKAAPVKDLLFRKPDNDVIRRMPMSGIIGPESVTSYRKAGVPGKMVPRHWFAMLFAKVLCFFTAIRSDALTGKIIHPRSAICMEMGRNAHDCFFAVPRFNTIQQGLEHSIVPGSIK